MLFVLTVSLVSVSETETFHAFIVNSSLASESPIQNISSARRYISQIRKPVLQCPDKIWPGYSWKGYQLLLVLSKSARSVLWQTDSGKVAEIPISQIPTAYRSPTFGFGETKFNGIDTLVFNLDYSIFKEPDKEIVPFILHEAFHFIGQKKWAEPKARGTLFPLRWEPRYYRNMATRLMIDGTSESKTTTIGEAMFWYQKWSKEFPEERAFSQDVIEGSAEYVTTMSTAIVEYGCNIKRDALRAYVADKARRKYYDDAVKFNLLGLDIEAYVLGGLAIANLSLTGDIRWFQQAALGVSPLDYLLKLRKPVRSKDAPDLLKKIRDQISTKNNDVISDVGDLFENWLSPGTIRMFIPYQWKKGSYSPKGFYVPVQDVSVSGFSLADTALFTSPSGTNIQARANQDFISVDSPCGESGFTFLISPRETPKDLNKFNYFGTNISLENGRAEAKRDSQGRAWLCLL